MSSICINKDRHDHKIVIDIYDKAAVCGDYNAMIPVKHEQNSTEPFKILILQQVPVTLSSLNVIGFVLVA